MNNGAVELRSIGPSREVPLNVCLKCGYSMDRASQINGIKAPKTDDFTICIRCGELLVFDEALRFRWPTHEEPAEAMQLPVLQQAIALVGGLGVKEDRS